ncbi:MAG: lyase family protein, partial [Oceanococcaceae bacterium]
MTTPRGKLWGGRFAQATDSLLEAYSASEHYDRRLYAHDIRGSQTHARMLGRQGVLSTEDVQAIVAGLDEIRSEIEAGNFPWDP